MVRFRFKLESLSRLRKNKEEITLGIFARAQETLQLKMEEKLKLERSLQETLLRRENLGSTQALNSLSLQLEDEFLTGTKLRITQADRQVVRAERDVEKTRLTYLIAKKERKALETLRDKQEREHQLKSAMHDRKEIEDLIVMRFGMEKEWAENEE